MINKSHTFLIYRFDELAMEDPVKALSYLQVRGCGQLAPPG